MLPAAVTSNVVYYSTVSKNFSYGTAPSSGLVLTNVTPVVIPPSTATATMHSVVIPANTFTTAGQAFRATAGGITVNSGLIAQNNGPYYMTVNGSGVNPGQTASLAVGTSNWRFNGYLFLTSISGTNGTFYIGFVCTLNSTTVQTFLSVTVPINAAITVNFITTTGSASTSTQQFSKFWLE